MMSGETVGPSETMLQVNSTAERLFPMRHVGGIVGIWRRQDNGCDDNQCGIKSFQ